MKLYTEGSKIILEIEDSDATREGVPKDVIAAAYMSAFELGFKEDNKHLIQEVSPKLLQVVDDIITDVKEKYEVID